ncbi:MAG TPA: diguanylate cyclase, partial [Lysobacter sp.]|nr:diguanylate cyclase [Lysobacter sp.]
MHGKAADIKRFLLWTAVYFIGAVLAARYLRSADGTALFWPSAGVGYVAVVRYGLRWTAVVALGTLLYLLLAKVSTTYLLYAIAGKTAATAIAAWYVLRGRTLHLRIEDGMRLLGGGVLLSVLSATFGVFGLLQADMLKPEAIPQAFTRWVLGDILGLAVVAPGLLLLTTTRAAGHQLSPRYEASTLRERMFWLALLATSLVAIYSLGGRGSLYVLGLISVPLVLLLWSSLRFSPVWTAVSTGLTVIYFTVATGKGLGSFTAPTTLVETAVLLLLLCLVALIPVMMALAGLEQRTTSYALYQRATRDTLTGLLNRTAFEEEARRRLSSSSTPATLLYIDLDNLKIINDSTSHVAGDDMIHAIAGAIGAAVGEDAVLARTGGDEFALLVPRAEAG